MADLNVQSNVLVTGYKCEVWAGNSEAEAIKVGMVDSVTISKNLQTQRANVIGTIMPVSIDPQALSASVSMSGFIATKEVVKAATYGSGDCTINAFCPDDSIYKQETVSKIPYLSLRKKNGDKAVSICHAEWCIPTSYQVQSQGQSYVKANIQMEAITMNIDSGYTDSSMSVQTSTGNGE